MLRPLNQKGPSGEGILGSPRWGVLASEMPSGSASTGLLNNDVLAGDAAGTRYRLRITSQPSAGVLWVAENGAFSFTGAPDGNYSATQSVDKYDPTANTTTSDTGTIQLQIGAATTQVSSDLVISYGVNTYVSSDLEMTWSVSSAAATNQVSNDLVISYSTQAYVSSDLVLTWATEGGSNNVSISMVSAQRIVIFEGSGERMDFEDNTALLAFKDGGVWKAFRDPDEESRYAADITNELVDRKTTPLQEGVELVLVGVTSLADPVMRTAVINGVERVFVIAFLGGDGKDPPPGWAWTARVRCANGERFDKTTYFSRKDG